MAYVAGILDAFSCWPGAAPGAGRPSTPGGAATTVRQLDLVASWEGSRATYVWLCLAMWVMFVLVALA